MLNSGFLLLVCVIICVFVFGFIFYVISDELEIAIFWGAISGIVGGIIVTNLICTSPANCKEKTVTYNLCAISDNKYYITSTKNGEIMIACKKDEKTFYISLPHEIVTIESTNDNPKVIIEGVDEQYYIKNTSKKKKTGGMTKYKKATLYILQDSTNTQEDSISSNDSETSETDLKFKCDSCGVFNSKDAKYCEGCGKDLNAKNYCSKCGAENDNSALYCNKCGSPLNNGIKE